jgi:ribosomal protein S18 acetylase RimI-like enzyme
MTFTIRGLEPEDLPAYKLLRDAMLAGHPEAFTSDADTERAKPAHHYLARLGHDRGGAPPFTLGAFDAAGQLVGAVTCERDARVKVRHIGHVTGMMVRDAAQRRGIGRALLDACIARARAAGELERLTLNVTSGNTHALRLYERAGFRRYGRLEHAMKLDGRYHDKDHLALDLSARPPA